MKYPETEWWVKVAFKSMYVTRGKFTFRVNSLQFIIKYWHPPHTLDKIPGLHTKLLYLYSYEILIIDGYYISPM